MPGLNVVGGNIRFPSLQSIADLFRSQINDTMAGATDTPGEGIIMPNTNPDLLVFLDSAVRDTYSDLRNVGDPALILDNYLLLGIPPLAAQNPAVRVTLSYAGYNNGYSWSPLWTLPISCERVLAVWERWANSTQTTTSTSSVSYDLDQVNVIPPSDGGSTFSAKYYQAIYMMGASSSGDTFTGWAVSQPSAALFLRFYDSSLTLLGSTDLSTVSSGTTVTAPANTAFFVIAATGVSTGNTYAVDFTRNSVSGYTYSVTTDADNVNFDTAFTSPSNGTAVYPLAVITSGSTFQATSFSTPAAMTLTFYNNALESLSSTSVTQGQTYTAPSDSAYWSLTPAGTSGDYLAVYTVNITQTSTITTSTPSDMPFIPMEQVHALPGTWQWERMGVWAMEQNAIVMPGCLMPVDLRMRCRITFPDFLNPATLDFSTAYVPILSCQNAVVAKMLRLYAKRFAPDLYQMAVQEDTAYMDKLQREVVRQQQSIANGSRAFGEEATEGIGSWYWNVF